MRINLLVGAFILAAIIAGVASAQPKKFDDFDFGKKAPMFDFDKKGEITIVGKWNATGDKNKGLVVEFTKDGDAKLSVSSGVVNVSFAGKYKLEDKALELTIDDVDKKGEKKTAKMTVKALTEDELVLDDKGTEEKLKRAK